MDHQNLHEFARTILDNVRLGWRQHRLAEKLSPEDIQLFLRAGKALEFDGDNQDIPFRLRWKQSITNSRADATVYLLLANFPRLDSSTARQLDSIFDQVENKATWDFVKRIGEQSSA